MSNIYKLTFSRFLGSIYFAVPIQTIFFFKIGLTFAQVMWLESILLVGIFLFEIPTGILGDRIGRKNSLIIGAILNLLTWIPWFIGRDFWMFAISFFLAGIAIAFGSGSDQALIYDELKSQQQERRMQKVYGIYSAAPILAAALSGLAGGLLTATQTLDSFYRVYWLTVVAEILSLFVLLTVREAPVPDDATHPNVTTQAQSQLFCAGMRLLRSNSQLRRIALLSLFSTPLAIVLAYIFQPYFMAAQVPNTWYGPAVFYSALLSAGAKLLAYRIESWLGVERGVLVVTLLPGLLWGLMALFFQPALAISLYLLNSAAGEVREPIFSDYINRQIPSFNRATVLSTISFLGGIYQFLVRPVLGYLADRDLRYAFLLAALVIVLGALAFRLQRNALMPNPDAAD